MVGSSGDGTGEERVSVQQLKEARRFKPHLPIPAFGEVGTGRQYWTVKILTLDKRRVETEVRGTPKRSSVGRRVKENYRGGDTLLPGRGEPHTPSSPDLNCPYGVSVCQTPTRNENE